MAVRRLKVEERKLNAAISKGEIVGIAFKKKENANLAWEVLIEGPHASPYEGGVFKVVLQFSEDYPFKAPNVQFITRTWNPSISEKGEICLEMLQKWKPVTQAQHIIVALRSLLQDPSPDAAQNASAATQLKDSKDAFETKAKEWTTMYATPE